MLRVEIFLIRVLQITFFTGLVGCAVTVVLSWISIFGGELLGRGESRPGDPIAPSQAIGNSFFHSDLRRQEKLSSGVRR